MLAHQLRMRVSAEGVETEEQAEFLRQLGCDELQGFHLGRPASANAASAFFASAEDLTVAEAGSRFKDAS